MYEGAKKLVEARENSLLQAVRLVSSKF